MNLILFFGSFDPIHNGHIKIALTALDYIKAKKLIFVPNFSAIDKKLEAKPVDRFNMIKTILSIDKRFDISDFEINKNRFCFTHETIKHYKNLYPNTNLFLLVGSDNITTIEDWKEFDYIKNNTKIIYYKRNKNFNDSRFDCISDEIISISSTLIKNEGLYRNIPETVNKYINENGLYSDSRLLTVMKKERYLHSMRVAQTAKNLMKIYNPELEQQAYIAGMYHDYCKEMNIELQKEIAAKIGFVFDAPKVLHGPVASYWLKKHLSFDNDNVLQAIGKHTTPFDFGKKQNSLLDKVIYCADKLEPLRDNNDIENIDYYRELAKKDIDQAFENIYNYFQNRRKK